MVKMTVVLPDDQLPVLLRSLQDKENLLHIRGEISSKLNSLITDYDFIVDSWPDYKTLVVNYNIKTTKYNGYLASMMSVFAKDNAALETILQKPAIAEKVGKIEISCFDRNTHEIVKSIPRLNGSPTEETWYHMAVTMDTLKLSAIPDGFKMTNLQPNQADIVNSVWKFNMGKHTETYIRDMVSKLPSCCLYNKEGNVVGFAAMYHYGDIGMLHVQEEHRRKGYGKVIVSQLAYLCLKKDMKVSVVVETMNEASFNLHQSVGFKTVSEIYVLYVNT